MQARIVFDQAAGRNKRVTDGGSASLILGRIDAPGQVFIANPSGVTLGSGASINVGGLVTSSLTLDPGDFMAASASTSRRAAAAAGN